MSKPLPFVRVIRAFGYYRVGATLQPAGLYRDHLVAAGLVELVKPEDLSAPAAQLVNAEVQLPRRSKAKHKAVSG